MRTLLDPQKTASKTASGASGGDRCGGQGRQEGQQTVEPPREAGGA